MYRAAPPPCIPCLCFLSGLHPSTPIVELSVPLSLASTSYIVALGTDERFHFTKCANRALMYIVSLLGGPVWSRELDKMIFVGLFYLKMFRDFRRMSLFSKSVLSVGCRVGNLEHSNKIFAVCKPC